MGNRIDRSALKVVRNYRVLAVGLAVAGAHSSGIETCLLQLWAEADMIVQLTFAIVVNQGTAAADSSRAENDRLADCKAVTAYNANSLRCLLAVRKLEVPSTEKLAKAKESLIQSPGYCCYTRLQQETSSAYLRDDLKLQRGRNPSCKQWSKRKTVVSVGLASDRRTVVDVRSDANCTTVRQLDRGFGPGISMGAPAFRY